MSVLDDIRAEIGEAFSDPELFFAPAVLSRPGEATGWKEGRDQPDEYPCMAMTAAYSDYLRAVADIPGVAVKLMIVGTSIEVDPAKGDTVTIDEKSWTITDRVKTDPARAMWTAQAVPAIG